MNEPKKDLLRMAAVMALCLGLLVLPRLETVQQALAPLVSPAFANTILLLTTGMQIPENLPTQPAAATEPAPPETTAPEPTQAPVQQVYFRAEEAENIRFNNYCNAPLDTENWLLQPLSWNLHQDNPSVLIFHTHATESYENLEGYRQTVSYRTLDTEYNMVSIGDLMTQKLQQAGIGVIHDDFLHDAASYNDAYKSSKSSTQAILKENPGIRVVLDVHRDAYADSSGKQVSNTVTHNGVTYSRIMILVGTDRSGAPHPDWEKNMAFAVKLSAMLERLCPGITRPILTRYSTYNQDLNDGALLIEMGTAGDTHAQALAAADILAQALIALSHGTG